MTKLQQLNTEMAYHVEGSHSHHTNPEEIDAVEDAIASLIQQGYDLGAADKSKTIGVMSPCVAASERAKVSTHEALAKLFLG